MYACLYELSSVDTAGGLKGSGGLLRIIYPIYSSWGAEKEKTPPRIVSYQYRMLGWVSIFSVWDTRSGHEYYCSVRPA